VANDLLPMLSGRLIYLAGLCALFGCILYGGKRSLCGQNLIKGKVISKDLAGFGLQLFPHFTRKPCL